MRKKISRLAWALLILAGGLTGILAPKSADAATCLQLLRECNAGCDPQDSLCFDSCFCEYLTCRGMQCN